MQYINPDLSRPEIACPYRHAALCAAFHGDCTLNFVAFQKKPLTHDATSTQTTTLWGILSWGSANTGLKQEWDTCVALKKNKLKWARSGTLSVAVVEKNSTFPSILFTIAMGSDRHQAGNGKDLPGLLGEGYCWPLSGTPRARGEFSSSQTWRWMAIFWTTDIFLTALPQQVWWTTWPGSSLPCGSGRKAIRLMGEKKKKRILFLPFISCI